MRIKITCDVLAVAGQDQTRIIAGVHYDHVMKRITATNGRAAVRLPVTVGEEGEDTQSGVISPECWKEAVRLARFRRLDEIHIVLPGDGAAHLDDGRTYPLREGNYPNVDAVIPKPDPKCVRLSITPELLRQVVAAAGGRNTKDKKTGEAAAAVTLYFQINEDTRDAVLSPIHVEVQGMDPKNADIVVMPARDSDQRTPEWGGRGVSNSQP